VSAELIAFTVPGEAVPWSRAGSNSGKRYTPKRQANFAGVVKLFASQAMAGQEPMTGPVELSVRAIYLIPASWPAKRKRTVKWKATKADIDNVVKGCMDAMNGIVFVDDAQIASLIAQKTYGPLAGLTVSIASLES